jgi:hypothetical protein
VALKEWAPTCAALGSGEQTILIRKGGIREPTFVPEARAFLLFPTSFHTDQQLLKPGAAERYGAAVALEPRQLPAVPLAQYAEVTGAWKTKDERVLQARLCCRVLSSRVLRRAPAQRVRRRMTVWLCRCLRAWPQCKVARGCRLPPGSSERFAALGQGCAT